MTPRVDGAGWQISKFHELLHLIRYILMFGVPGNFDTAVNEHHHGVGVKVSAEKTSKQKISFDKQMATCCYEDLVLSSVTGLFTLCNLFEEEHNDQFGIERIHGIQGIGKSKNKPVPYKSYGASTITIEWSPTEDGAWIPDIVLNKKEYTDQYPEGLLDCIVDEFFDTENCSSENPPEPIYQDLQFKTEYRKNDD